MHVNGVTNTDITRDVVLEAKTATSKYTHYLAQKKEQEQEKHSKKRKAETDAIHEHEDRRQKMPSCLSNGANSKLIFHLC